MIDFTRIPRDTLLDINNWVAHGWIPGEFLTAILRNDLRSACERADYRNRHVIFEIVAYLYNEAPSMCWGSEQNVKDWIESHRNIAKGDQ